MKSAQRVLGFLVVIAAGGFLFLGAEQTVQRSPVAGYDDTPFLPRQKWRVHDSKRPQPRVITPGTFSRQDAPGQPPSDAVVLFDGRDLSKWKSAKDGPAPWKLGQGYVEVVPKSGDILTREEFGDCQLHLEWRTPTPPEDEGQDRGNSGVFLMGLYEIQVLNSFQNRTYADGHAGAIYGQYPPLVNASRRPGEWQVYDIIFTAPRFKDGKLATPAYVTVMHNGVLVHNHTAIMGPTEHRKLPNYVEHGLKAPIRLQDHRNPVRYRNIWVRELKSYDEP